MSTAFPPKPPAYLKWWVCLLLLFASTINYMDRQALSLTSKRISDYLSIKNEALGALEGAFNLGFAIGGLAIGWLVDRGNLRLIYPTMVILWSMAGFAAGFAESYLFLLGCRIALGMFEAGNIPCGVFTVKRILKPEERPLGNGMFQSGSALGAIVMPLVVWLCLESVSHTDEAIAWQLPFRVVGLAGLAWAAVWLLTVRTRHIRPVDTAPPAESDTYWAIFRNRRFWVALIVVMSINTPWRSFGFWLPKLLQQEKGYAEQSMLFLTPGFFAAADAGSIAVGVVVLWLTRRGMRLPRARLLCFGGCTILTLLSILTAVFPNGPLLIVVLYLLGFGALGLFPIYYALSQEISAKHQGKVTGTLSCLNAGYLVLLFPFQGWLIDRLESFSLALGVVGVFPMAGLLAMALFWERPRNEDCSPGGVTDGCQG
jgi:ACS family hexuronate transporter-like MFS transporter